MTRTEQIQAAKAFTEKHKDSHRVFLEEGYIEASAQALFYKDVIYECKALDMNMSAEVFEVEYLKKRIWAIDANGIATTDY